MIYQSEIRFLEGDLTELWGVETKGSHFGHKWYEKMSMYLTQIKPVSHENWAVDGLGSLVFFTSKDLIFS